MARTKRFIARSQSTSSTAHALEDHIGQPSINHGYNSNPIGTSQGIDTQPHELAVQQEKISSQSPQGCGPSQPSNERPPTNPPKRTCNKYWVVDVVADNGLIDEERLRVRDVLVLPRHKRVVLEWNEDKQPVGDSCGLLHGFLGHIACDPKIFPICFDRWPNVPPVYKENTWKSTIKPKFVLESEYHYNYCMQNMGKKWKDNRYRICHEFYKKDKTYEQNIENYPQGITRENWAGFLQYRLSEKGKRYSAINTANRKKQKIPHTLGSKTIARLKRELEIRDGKKYSRGEMYPIAHTKRDGNFVNEEAMLKNDQLLTQMQEGLSDEEAYVHVFGKEHPGRVRGMGFGVVPSQYRRSSNSSGSSSSTVPTPAEYNALKEELESIKGKMVEYDMMKEQMAFFMQSLGAQIPSNFSFNQCKDILKLLNIEECLVK
ncbi:uncharacterized protein LOC133292948 [Gastrolobium bilobum]|uniref:uncharacterized protein LOC133292948 n=1 Tax=Gastrolobium bilobum TaxID=150636 RepID=UPI002AAF6DEC|nr:uncharacterized protein LOC133292948 [Gastrolobium bilobum]